MPTDSLRSQIFDQYMPHPTLQLRRALPKNLFRSMHLCIDLDKESDAALRQSDIRGRILRRSYLLIENVNT